MLCGLAEPSGAKRGVRLEAGRNAPCPDRAPPGGESAPCQAGSEGRAEMPAPGPWGWAEGQQPRPNALPQDKHRRRLSLSPGKRGLQILEKSSQKQTPGLIPWSRSYLSPPEGTLAADPWTGSDKSKQGLAGRHFERMET